MCFIILFFKIVLFVLLYRDIKLVLLQQWAEIWRLDFFLVSMSNTRESSLLHLKLINSSFLKKEFVHHDLSLDVLHYMIHCALFLFPEPTLVLLSCAQLCVTLSQAFFSSLTDLTEAEVKYLCEHNRWFTVRTAVSITAELKVHLRAGQWSWI